LKWNRAFSATLSIGIVVLAALVTLQLGAGAVGATFAALITAFSPEVLANSHIIGVDIVMALFCLLSTTFALKAARSFSWGWFILSGLSVGPCRGVEIQRSSRGSHPRDRMGVQGTLVYKDSFYAEPFRLSAFLSAAHTRL